MYVCMIGGLIGQNVTVSGKVAEAASGEPLIGVTIVEKGTSNGTATDIEGSYSISVPSDAVLTFSYTGYEPQDISVEGRTEIAVNLETAVTALAEIIVVGYGTMEKNNVTGAITTVNVEETQKVPVPNVVESLRGQVSGLQVQRTSGQPGSGITFKIRGNNSLGALDANGNPDIDGANAPLVVIDGVPLVGGNLSELNPDDIASINILKDAASAAIYGASGANGAVLITTKKGKKGEAKLSFRASTGIVDLANRINFMNGDEYLQYRLDSDIAGGSVNPTVNAALRPNEVANYIAGQDVDWQDQLIQTGRQHNAGFSAMGGTEILNYYISGDYYKEEGIVSHSDYERFSLRFNGDIDVTNWLQIGARVQFSKSTADETANAIDEFNLNGGFAPFIPISNNTPLGDLYDEAGNFSKFITSDQFQINPLHRYNESELDRNVTRSYISPYLNLEIIPGLKYTLNTFIEDRQTFYGRFFSSNYRDAQSEAEIQNTKENTYLVDNILNYKKYFGSHGVNFTAVYGMQWYDYKRIGQIADYIPTDLLSYYGLDYALSTNVLADNGFDNWGKVYYIGRLGYSFNDRYSATFTLRRDGSSRFAPENRWGYFPSASVAWNIHNENFMNNTDLFNFLKLRLSYAELGNDRFPTYLYRQGTNSVQTAVGVDADGNTIFVNGFGPSTVASNPNLKWETSNQVNIGIDFGILRDKISGSIDLYQTNTTDLLLYETINPVPNNGATLFASNVGETESRGIDLGIKAKVLEYQGLSWTAQLNWATSKNKIVRLSRGDVDENGNPVDNPANGWFIGQDIQVIYDYEFTGVDPETGKALLADQNGDGIINSDDRTFLGSPTPSWFGGLNNIFSYKGLELSVLFEAVQGVTRVNNYIGGFTGRNNQIALDYWTPNNPNAAYPGVGSGSGFSGTFGNSIKVQDASFVALRNVSLAYKLPESILGNVPLTDISIYIRGNNLHYWTDYTDAFSPESSVGSYPITRTVIFGLKAGF